MKILLVEDDRAAAEVLKNILTHQHYTVDLADDGETGLSFAEMFAYDLILLDIMLPKLDGLMFCRQLRAEKNDTPILLLTALDSSTSKVIGLDAGANDYVVKPFEANELLARIRALVRQKSPALSSVIEAGNVRLDSTSSKVTCNGQILRLTAKEYALLEQFMRNSHRIFSQETLLDYLWSSEEIPLANTVRAHIKALRQKLKQAGANDLIETVYGQGYRLKLKENGHSQVKHSAATKLDLQPTQVDATVVERYQPQLSSALADIWKRFQPQYSDRITILEQNITLLLANTLTEEQAQQAQASAHQLIGSLGSFGLVEASRLCREIEQIFRAGVKQSRAEVERLSQLIVALRQELQRSVTIAPDARAKRCHRQRFANIKQQPHLLIVDLDVQLSQQLINEAAIWGIQALVATLTEVREAIAQNCPDVVLLDLGFSNSIESGLELLAELTTNNWDVPVLVFSAVEDFANRLKVARLGGQIFLHKPVHPASVIAAVIQVLQRSDIVQAKIMVVDDDPQMLDILRTLLEPWGFELTLLNDCASFWEILNAFNPDLLILDVQMPLSGIELCQVVRNDLHWNQLPVLFLSVHKDAETVNRVFAAGADDYLSKPIQGPELIARIMNRLERTLTFGNGSKLRS
ncbi:response regulator [Tolypothrix sp. VBCCA 56010]|uniref:response regulator n=1 Tax=Tolypothrix sp. VBCCA 56010 TaxID=3137731 RepID=UPI003D7D00CB